MTYENGTLDILIEDLQSLINKLYIDNVHAYGFYDIMLYSDDYKNDMSNFLDRLFSDVSQLTIDTFDVDEFVENTLDFSVIRKNRYVSRLRAQFEALKIDNVITHSFYGKQNMSDVILKFIEAENDKQNHGELVSVINRQYEIYDSFFNIKDEESFSHAASTYEKMASSVETLKSILVTHDTIYFDAYLLSRMFRKFTVSSHEHDTHIESSTVITYTGAYHTERYANFFRNILNVKNIDFIDNSHGSNYMRCLTNKYFNQYFP